MRDLQGKPEAERRRDFGLKRRRGGDLIAAYCYLRGVQRELGEQPPRRPGPMGANSCKAASGLIAGKTPSQPGCPE